MRNMFKKFAMSEDGAITVDWVVLTALVLGVQILLLLTPARQAMVGVSEGIAGKIEEVGDFTE